jgi:hypothetical protein
MEATALDDTLTVGDHCRFCPAKLICPAISSIFRSFAMADPKQTLVRSDVQAAQEYPLIAAAKMYIKAAETDTLDRLMNGKMKDNGVVKLVNKKADRVWKPEAAALFQHRYGDQAMTAPELKSPAQMEKIDATSKKLVHEYAFTPQSGFTVASIDDKRPAVSPLSAAETFKGVANE